MNYLILALQFLALFWLCTFALNHISVVLRTIVHNMKYIVGYADWCTGLSIMVMLLFGLPKI